jgi:hypothetical protein
MGSKFYFELFLYWEFIFILTSVAFSFEESRCIFEAYCQVGKKT